MISKVQSTEVLYTILSNFYKQQIVSEILEFIESKQDLYPVNLLETVLIIRFLWTLLNKNTIKKLLW